MDHALAFGVGQFAVLLCASLGISIAAERLRIPVAVLLVALGVCAGTLWHLRPPFAFGPTLLFIFLPPLIFEAAWSTDLSQLKSNWFRIAVLAFPGTIFVAFTIAGGLTLFGALSFGSALLLGGYRFGDGPGRRDCRIPKGPRTARAAHHRRSRVDLERWGCRRPLRACFGGSNR